MGIREQLGFGRDDFENAFVLSCQKGSKVAGGRLVGFTQPPFLCRSFDVHCPLGSRWTNVTLCENKLRLHEVNQMRICRIL